ncbi:MAG: GAF domain-containing sensor histidine kinase [Armatimonadota bacterium]|nr:GAF domain-containing sensor histidine kinase [Armatimonadota bacterium]MDR7437696.1 GAF domain-containing sensor histidine kinase [Armatimonadota bacterium]MDR7472391.1 GAF domain-containing sensor histidine kinase [Armatimonadota bacterium]MDR7507515.1 GAF domain-containing sensor histidine kinase [Armatimonadota bacterium]MDR7509774.1 GAF domain-containing sensor histidine kinase [Armatimonadota bacterium]
MTVLTGALAVGVGIHLALTLFLLLRYLEGRERQIGWWAVAYALFASHVVAETLLTLTPSSTLVAIRHALFLASAWAMVQSFRPDRRVTILAVVGIAASAVLAEASWTAAAVVASVLGGAAFAGSAGLLYGQERGLQTTSARLLFWGLLLTGMLALVYPLLRPHPVLAGVGAGFSGLFTLLFSIGIVLLALQRTRDLVTMSAIAESLNRSLDVHSAVSRALDLLVDLMRLSSGWIYLRRDGGFAIAATKNLPLELAASDMAAMEGDCRCLEMLRNEQLADAVTIVHCERLEQAGWDAPRHVTVPLRTAGGTMGVMNLLLPRRRALTSRELATLSAIGDQIGLAAERARLYEEVRAKEAMRGELLQKLITAQEEERRRIARELHDEAGQALTALILNLEVAERSAAPPEQQRLSRLRGIAEDTLRELRKMIYDLRPTILDDLGLAAAIRWYVKEHVEPQGLQVDLTLAGLDERMPHHIETAVFRIVQEALTNVLKHADARRAWVTVALADGQVRLSVTDDGRGFDPQALPRARDGRGLGLMGMQERTELLGGTWKITSRPQAGTRIEAVIPVEVPSDGH